MHRFDGSVEEYTHTLGEDDFCPFAGFDAF